MRLIKTITKFAVLLVLAQFFTACATSLTSYNKDTKVMSFRVTDEINKDIQMENPTYKKRSGQCLTDSFWLSDRYVKTYGSIIVSKRIIDTQKCQWNGATDGYFENYVKRVFNAKNISLISKVSIGQYIFRKYQLDNDNTTNTIQAWQSGGDTFVIDKSGFLSNELLEELKKNNVK